MIYEAANTGKSERKLNPCPRAYLQARLTRTATPVNSVLGRMLSVCPASDPPQPSDPALPPGGTADEEPAPSRLLCDLEHVTSLSGPLPFPGPLLPLCEGSRQTKCGGGAGHRAGQRRCRSVPPPTPQPQCASARPVARASWAAYFRGPSLWLEQGLDTAPVLPSVGTFLPPPLPPP